MEGVHDLGGKEGFGPIDVNDDGTPFHHAWEGRMWGIDIEIRSPDWTIDWWRHVRENIDPVDYLSRPYFDQWMQTDTAALIDSGMVTPEELFASVGKPVLRTPGSPLSRTEILRIAATRAKDFSRPIAAVPAFKPGDDVRARLLPATGHTRLPAYARGHVGVIHAHHGAHVFADASARGEERAEHIYSVVFRASELWPEAKESNDRVFLDLWESYLERR